MFTHPDDTGYACGEFDKLADASRNAAKTVGLPRVTE